MNIHFLFLKNILYKYRLSMHTVALRISYTKVTVISIYKSVILNFTEDGIKKERTEGKVLGG